MPIIIPTPAEFARMSRHQRDKVRRRLHPDELQAVLDYIWRAEFYAHDPLAEARLLSRYTPPDPDAAEHRRTLRDEAGIRRWSRQELVEEFEHTRPRHKGRISWAAEMFGCSPQGLVRRLHRCREIGLHVDFIDDTKNARSAS